MRKCVAVLCLASTALVGSTRTTFAADADDAKRSAELFKAGVAAGKSGDFAQAEAAFRASYEIRPSASTLRNLALAEMKLGKMVDALAHLRSAMSSGTWTVEQRRIVQENLNDAYAATGHLAITTTEGARVAVDGALLEKAAPLEQVIDVAEGKRRVEARLGARTTLAEVEAEPGRVMDVNLPLPEVRESAAPAPLSPSQPLQPISRSSEAHATVSWWTPPHVLGVGLGAVAAVGAGVGAYAVAASQTAAADASALRSSLAGACGNAAAPAPCGTLRDKIAAVHQDDVLATLSFASGAAAAIGAIVVFAIVGPKAPGGTGALRLAPAFGPGEAGVMGSF